jgi:hypothetical protein
MWKLWVQNKREQSERCEPSELRESQLPNWPLSQRTSLVSGAD